MQRKKEGYHYLPKIVRENHIVGGHIHVEKDGSKNLHLKFIISSPSKYEKKTNRNILK
jgi:hypothetical protein